MATETKIPFFLPDSFNIVPQPEMGETKLIEKPKSDLGIILSDKSDEEILELLKELSPSKLELLVLELSDPNDIEGLLQFFLRSESTHYDLL